MATTTEQAGSSSLGNNPENPLFTSTPRPASRRRPTSPPPTPGRHQDETVAEIDPNELFSHLDPLEELTGPVDDQDVDTATEPVVVATEKHTFKSLGKIGHNPVILARRSEALLKGLKTINKQYLMSAQKASRKMYTVVFPHELELLYEILIKPERLQLLSGDKAYRVQKDVYQVLLRILFDLRKASQDSFRLAGKTPPSIPSWGDDDDLEETYLENDYEILGICFRVEVEHFLWLLDKYHDFVQRQPQERYPETTEAAREFARASRTPDPRDQSASPQRTPRDQFTAGSADEYRQQSYIRSTPERVGYFGRNSGLPRNNRRMSEILNPMSTIFEESSHSNFGIKGEPTEMEQMRRMSSQPPRGRDSPPHLSPEFPGDRARNTPSPANFRNQQAPPPRPPNPPDDPSDDDDDDDDRSSRARRRFNPYAPNRSQRGPPAPAPNPRVLDTSSSKEPHFDLKLKYENVPTWDGNTDTIIRWMLKINDIARESSTVFRQLGRIVPKRLEGSAEIWY
jgi:hypothetical protein